MLDKIVEKSPAKINLFLKIINKREDGFHNIRTGVTYINLFVFILRLMIALQGGGRRD